MLSILAIASVLTYAQSEPDATPTPDASSVIQEDIFVRGGPGRDYLPVGKLLAGDRVRPLSRNATSDWVLIAYGKNYGWIRRDLAFWVENIDALPVMDTANLTPSPVIPTTPANTPVLAATETPSGNWVELNTEAQSGYVRAGPGRTYLRLGQLYTGDEVEPISRNADGSWIMIRFGDGFGWISRNLVRWIDDIDSLPVITADNLTPTATFTLTSTSTPTATPTSTFTPSATATATLTATYTNTPSATPTATNTQTPSITPSATFTQTSLPSATPLPTLTATLVPSETPVPTIAPSATTAPSFTPVPTETLIEPTATPVLPTATYTVVIPTQTNTLVPTATFTDLPTATDAPTETAIAVVIVPSATATLLPTNTPTALVPTETLLPPTSTVTASLTATTIPPTSTYTLTFTLTATTMPASSTPSPATATLIPTTVVPVPMSTVAQAITATLQPSATATENSAAIVTTSLPTPSAAAIEPQSAGGVSAEALIAGLVLLVIGVYGFFYWRGLSTAERYANGFVIDTCPVCGRGHLIVETRQERLFGVPRVRHSVRCSECRSVLREVSDQQWRYAVDPIENPDLYQQYNGQLISDETLAALAADQARKQPPPE